jgi:hypothetical protein
MNDERAARRRAATSAVPAAEPGQQQDAAEQNHAYCRRLGDDLDLEVRVLG